MTQQQLLLVVLSLVVAFLSVMTGMQIFSERGDKAIEDALINDILVIASRAQDWYRKPQLLGGGGRSFKFLSPEKVNFDSTGTNGHFVISSKTATSFIVTATGNVDQDKDGHRLRVSAWVGVDSLKSLKVLNR